MNQPKNIQQISAILATSFLALALAACGGDSGNNNGGGDGPGDQPVAPTTTAPAPPVEVVNGTVPADAAAQMAALAEPLFPLAMAEADSAVNPAYSPLSVYLALAMTANGASGQSAEEFAQLLGGTREQVNALAAGVMTEYVTTDDGPILSVANSLWLDNQFTVDPAFEQSARALYRAEVASLDLVTEGKDRINAWVDEKTNHLIEQIVEQVSEYAVAFLVNALYFKGQWQTQFEEYATADQPFTLLDGTKVQVPTMFLSGLYAQYFKSEDGEGILLPYEGGRFGMLLVMPATGVDQVTWDGQRLVNWLGQTEGFEGIDLYLPKWESELSASLIDPLKSLGLKAPFEPSGDLAGIGSADGVDLVISEVAHKTVVKVDEAGTEAAAVTSIEIDAAAAPAPVEPVIVRFDQPFVFAIMDLNTDLPLFLGQVTDPLAAP
ncbi:MAG: serpin family protein [Micrococcales bacterium]|nr:serpin family protein [Micrococcales bacterium]